MPDRVIPLTALLGALAAATASAGVDLSLEPAQVSVSSGQTFDLELWARSVSPASFDGADVALVWPASALNLEGIGDPAGPYDWAVSGFLAGSPANETWTDGTAMYTCTAPLGAPSPTTDLLIVRLRFRAVGNNQAVTVTISREGGTEVAAGGTSVLGNTTGATVTIGTPGGGAASGPTNTAPTAVIVADKVDGDAPLEVRLDASGSTDSDAGDQLSWTWDFGDGQTGTGEQVTHTFSDPGIYTVTLVVTDNQGVSDAATIAILVRAPEPEPTEPPTGDSAPTGSGSEDGSSTEPAPEMPLEEGVPGPIAPPFCGTGVLSGAIASLLSVMAIQGVRPRTRKGTDG